MAIPVPVTIDARSSSLVGKVSYNGVRFPPAMKCTVDYTPEYDKSRRFVKYIRATVNIECLMFPGVLDLINTSHTPYTGVDTFNYESPDSVNDADSTLPYEEGTDPEMQEIRKRLLQPGQEFRLQGQGVGDIILNSPTGLRDSDNGPKPQMLAWSPLTNKLAKIKWKLEVCFPPCADPYTSSSTGEAPIAEFSFALSLDINERGLSTRTINGTYEVALSRIPTATTTNPASIATQPYLAGKSAPFDMNAMEVHILSAFPSIPQFTRKVKFDLSEDRKVILFTITDTELDNDEPFGEGCYDEKVTISTESRLDAGFEIWGTSLNGTITLFPGYPKGYAEAEIYRLFNKYYTKSTTKGSTKHKKPKPDESSEGSQGSLGWPSHAILRSLRFTDSIFDRSLSFDIAWDVFCDLKYIMLATNMFRPVVETDNEEVKQWNFWKGSIDALIGRGGYQTLGMNENTDIVISLCDPFQHSATDVDVFPTRPRGKKKRDSKRPKETPVDPFSGQPKVAIKYSKFEQTFALDIDRNTTRHRHLYHINPKQDKKWPSQKGIAQREWPAQSAGSIADSIHHLGENQYTLTYTGIAVSLEAPPQIPSVIKYGTRDVYPIGVDKIIPRKLGNGIDVTAGKTYAIHGLIWRKQYAILSPPIGDIILTDGFADQHV